MPIKTRSFDPAFYLDSDEATATYMMEALDTNDPGFIADALGVILRVMKNDPGAARCRSAVPSPSSPGIAG